MAGKALFISMLGEAEHYEPKDFTNLCPSGYERDWVLEWHGASAASAGLTLEGTDICRGEALPDPKAFDGVVLGGTMHVVTEDREWLHRLRDWLKTYRAGGKPLLAICGGHQMLSTQFGEGTLTGRDAGTLAGTYPVSLTDAGRSHPLFTGMSESPKFHFANYLHVIPSPAQNSGVLAVQNGSPAIALDHGGGWFSTQFHPEARKASWDRYYSLQDAEFQSAYEPEHDGAALIENFFKYSATHGS